MIVMHGDICSPILAHYPFNLKQPRIRQIVDMSEYGTAVHKIKVSAFEREMRLSHHSSKSERWAYVFLVPYNVTGAYVDTPNFALCCTMRKPSDHSAGLATEI